MYYITLTHQFQLSAERTNLALTFFEAEAAESVHTTVLLFGKFVNVGFTS